MRLEWQILAACGLDLLAGDPRWLPHPVRTIAWVALRLEKLTRLILPPRAAGIVTALLVYGIAGAAAWGLIRLAALAHPLAADAAAIVVIYTTIAARDLAKHSMAVYRPLVSGDLPAARKSVSMIVGRDTEKLDEADVARAAVESVAESTVDGVTAPLFYAAIFGPVGAMVYRAINTLDSTFGFKDERYLRFGWASARIDDLANWLPARLTAPLMALAALLLRQRPAGAWRITRRDARKHDSPNAGFAEAAMAGALGVELGGTNVYGGEPIEKPTLGDACMPLSAGHIRQAVGLMLAAAGLFVAVCLCARFATTEFWQRWRPA